MKVPKKDSYKHMETQEAQTILGPCQAGTQCLLPCALLVRFDPGCNA